MVPKDGAVRGTRAHPDEPKLEAFQNKVEFEDDLCDSLGIERGSILISCTAGIPLFKRADSRVRIQGQIQKLAEVETDPPSGALSELRRRHLGLWRFYVFAEPKLVDAGMGPVIADAVALGLSETDVTNSLRRSRQPAGWAIIDRFGATLEAQGEAPLTSGERRELLQSVARSPSRPGADSRLPYNDLLGKRLNAARKPTQPRLELDGDP